MASETFSYIFNVNGNSTSVIPNITEGVTGLGDKLKNMLGVFDSFGGKIVVLNQLSQYVQGLSQTVDRAFEPGAALNASLADLSAISGEAGEGLKMIERYAREAAKTFGGSAAQSVESYKLLLGQLSPELAKTPKALKAMGDNISVLSKTMEGNTTAAAEVLTTAMNQYGVSLDNPIEASRKMAEMMNVMAAAGREGSAELPTIKVALEQAGMAAKAAGVSFEETNAAIQVLDKAGKKGSEGGVALRNVMTTLQRGRFLPKDIQKELSAAGVDINLLGDKSVSLADKLRYLQPLMNDNALFTKLFGRENASAAMALVQEAEEVDRLAEAITGTNTAFEQAEIVMESYNEKKSRIKAQFDDLKISIFNASGDMGIWTQVVAESLVPVAQLLPLITGMGSGLMAVGRGAFFAYTKLGIYNGYLAIGQVANLGFAKNTVQATVALVRFATVGVFQALKGVGAWILSLVTGGTASATFAGIASASFAAFRTAAVTACRAVSVAISSIPIIGWIAAAIAALAALTIYFWNTSAEFRGILKGLGAAFRAFFIGVWEMAETIFGALGDLFLSALKFDGQGIKDALSKLSRSFSIAGRDAGRAFEMAYLSETVGKKKTKEEGGEEDEIQKLLDSLKDNPADGGVITNGLAGLGGNTDKSDKVKNINITIDNLVGKFEIHTTNLKEDVSHVKDMVAEALMGAVNDVNYAL